MPQQAIELIYQRESRRVFATLVRLIRDFDLAEEALHEAFTAALEKWTQEGIPENPRAWLVSTGRFKAIDLIRKKKRLVENAQQIADRLDEVNAANESKTDSEIEDDRLRLIFTCCHPAIAAEVQIPLTLREVCGLTTEEIARAFLVNSTTMAQRIVRGKSKIRTAGIPFIVPQINDLPARLEAVLSVIYLVFNEGYSASSGDQVTRADISSEAIRLCRVVMDLLPEPEVKGLLALMLLQESRRTARTNTEGDIVLLEDQDRSLWNREMILEGTQLIEQSLTSRRFGVYTIQAAIADVHASAHHPDVTEWGQIVQLYDLLLRMTSSPVVQLNRGVAIAMRDGPQSGLEIIENLLKRGELADYHLAHAARAELYRRLGQTDQARQAFEQALQLARQEPERRFLKKRLEQTAPKPSVTEGA